VVMVQLFCSVRCLQWEVERQEEVEDGGVTGSGGESMKRRQDGRQWFLPGACACLLSNLSFFFFFVPCPTDHALCSARGK